MGHSQYINYRDYLPCLEGRSLIEEYAQAQATGETIDFGSVREFTIAFPPGEPGASTAT